MSERDQESALAELRRDIDRIDGEMHGLLMERGRIIDRLISVKGGTAATGSAFRPEREASMMRIMAERHEGGLPFDAVEGIWRIIISTFTHLQSPFGVHVDVSSGAAEMRDSARYHFGFTVPLHSHHKAGDTIAAVAASRGDLGLIGIDSAPDTAWWRALEPEGAPKVIARLPFVDRSEHPAATPVLVVAKSISGEGLGGMLIYSATALDHDPATLLGLGVRLLVSHGSAMLLAIPRGVEIEVVKAKLRLTSLVIVGSHPSTAPAA